VSTPIPRRLRRVAARCSSWSHATSRDRGGLVLSRGALGRPVPRRHRKQRDPRAGPRRSSTSATRPTAHPPRREARVPRARRPRRGRVSRIHRRAQRRAQLAARRAAARGRPVRGASRSRPWTNVADFAARGPRRPSTSAPGATRLTRTRRTSGSRIAELETGRFEALQRFPPRYRLVDGRPALPPFSPELAQVSVSHASTTGRADAPLARGDRPDRPSGNGRSARGHAGVHFARRWPPRSRRSRPIPAADRVAPSCVRRSPVGSTGVFGVIVDPGTEIVPNARLQGGDLFLCAADAGRPSARGWRSPEPAYPVYERGRACSLAGSVVSPPRALAGEERTAGCRDLDAFDAWDEIALFWVCYPNTRRGAVAPLGALPRSLRRAPAQHGVSCSAPTRRTPSSGSTSHPFPPCRSSDRTNVVVFNTLSKRSSMTGYRSGFVCAPTEICDALPPLPPDGRHRAAGVRANAPSVAAVGRTDAHVDGVRELYRHKGGRRCCPHSRTAGCDFAGLVGRPSISWLDVGRPRRRSSGGDLLEHGIVVAPGIVSSAQPVRGLQSGWRSCPRSPSANALQTILREVL